jgi:hypothetical protein
MPPDGVIQIAFDRYLLPSTVTRQSIGILDGNNQPLAVDLAPNILYDPVARTVTLVRPKSGPWLTPGQPFKILFVLPQSDSDPNGLRAIDQATLDPNQKLEIAFFVAQLEGGSPAAATGVVPGEPSDISFCNDVLPIFALKCSAPSCHGSGNTAAASLILDTSTGVSHTARTRIAQGANTGARADNPEAPGLVFGIDMPIISVDDSKSPPVGDPGNSWLLYKLEMGQSPADAGTRPALVCPSGADAGVQTTPYNTLVPTAHLEPDDVERSALANLMKGSPMPYPVLLSTSYVDQPLTFQERETIRMWIARGAHVETCGACTTPPSPDGGP